MSGSSIRDEVERIRERTRQEARLLGVPDAEIERRVVAAVAEYCARWGLNPQTFAGSAPTPPPGMPGPGPAAAGPGIRQGSSVAGGAPGARPGTANLGPAAPGSRAPPPGGGPGARPPASAEPPHPNPASHGPHAVDLGASPLRASTVDVKGPTKLADLLARRSAPPSPNVTPPPGASRPSAPLGSTSLQDLLARVRESQQRVAVGARGAGVPSGAPAPGGAWLTPGPGGAPATGPPRPLRVRDVQVDRRAEFAAAPAAEGGEGAVSPRRRAILDEFDRTFHEVQSKLDQQLGGVDVAPVGEPVIPETLAPGDAALEEMERLAVDLDRAMEDLHRMMAHFQDLTGRLAAIMARFAGPPPGQGGGAA